MQQTKSIIKIKVNLGPKHVCVILFVINAFVFVRIGL